MICVVDGGERLDDMRALFLEYARSLDFDICFDGFAQELADLPGCYAPPDGRLLLAVDGDELAGCVALRRHDAVNCEVKRLWVRPAFRGRGVGRQLVEAVIAAGRTASYQGMLLHTLASMAPAARLYRSLGFAETPAYDATDLPGVLFLRRAL